MKMDVFFSRLIAFGLAFLLGMLIYVFALDFLRHCFHIDLYPSLRNPRYTSPAMRAHCGDGNVTYPEHCDAGKFNGLDTSSSLKTYLLWGRWYCNKACTASDLFMFWEPPK